MFEHIFINNNSDKTLVLFHGTGGDETVLLPLAKHVAPSMNILSIRGNVVCFGKRRFCKVDHEDQIIDEVDMLQRVPGILAEVAHLHHHYHLKELWALGFSNGANTIAALLFQERTPFKRVVLMRPMDFSIKTRDTQLNGLPILIHSGRSDDVIPYTEAVKLEKHLRVNGACVDHKIYDLDHRMRAYEMDELKEWFDEALANES